MPSDESPFSFPEARDHTFDTIVGQELVKRFLLRAVERARLPQSIMFVGPAGVGKRSLMYALTKHLVSLDHAPGSAEAERAWGKVQRGTHPDVISVEPKSASGQILTKQIEEMQERACYAPLESSRKVILVSPIEAMNPVSANHILKILEEPPRSLTFLVGCRQIHRVLPTIRSRCALLRCPPVETAPLAQWIMERVRCPESVAVSAARLSGGRPGVALEMLTGQNQEQRRHLTHSLEYFRTHGYGTIFRVGHDLLNTAGGLEEALAFLEAWFRDLLVGALMNPTQADQDASPDLSLAINTDLAEPLAAALSEATPEGYARALERVLACQKRFTRRPYIDGDLVMEVLLTDLGIALKN